MCTHIRFPLCTILMQIQNHIISFVNILMCISTRYSLLKKKTNQNTIITAKKFNKIFLNIIKYSISVQISNCLRNVINVCL